MASNPCIRTNRYSVLTLEWPCDCKSFEQWLIQQSTKAPALMQEIAVVLKPSKDHHTDEIGQALKALGNLGINLIGLTGDSSHRTTADHFGLTWFSLHNLTKEIDQSPETISATTNGLNLPMIVEGPVRSGRQVYAKNCDLIVIGQVSEGAEIMADGNVHIYGRLRGRAAAGISGQFDAQIFCQVFEPELISIAGVYCGFEQIASEIWSDKVRVGLEKTTQSFTFKLI